MTSTIEVNIGSILESSEIPKPIIHTEILECSQKVFESIGVGHSEFIYQRALAIELRSYGYVLETEKRVLITYIDREGNKHHLGDERIDIYLHKCDKLDYEVVIELKAIVKPPKQSEVEQVLKYKRELNKDFVTPRYGIIINFPQAGTKKASEKVDFMEINL